MSRAVFFGVFGFKSDKRAIVCYYKTKRHAGIGDKTVTLRTDWLNLHPFVFLLPTPAWFTDRLFSSLPIKMVNDPKIWNFSEIYFSCLYLIISWNRTGSVIGKSFDVHYPDIATFLSIPVNHTFRNSTVLCLPYTNHLKRSYLSASRGESRTKVIFGSGSVDDVKVLRLRCVCKLYLFNTRLYFHICP